MCLIEQFVEHFSRVPWTCDNTTLCLFSFFFPEKNTLRNRDNTIQHGVIQTRGEKGTIAGGRKKKKNFSRSPRLPGWYLAKTHNALFYMVEIHKISSCRNTPWDVNDGFSVVTSTYAVRHCLFIAYRTKWVIALKPIYRYTPYISMEHYGNGVQSLNSLQNIENISNKTIKCYKYSYSTEPKDCRKSKAKT